MPPQAGTMVGTNAISRRELLQGAGALIVSFSILGPASRVLAQAERTAPGTPNGDVDPASLDSWLALTPDGQATVFSGKVELGTGVETALSQIVAEELDLPFNHVHMHTVDTARVIDQGLTVGSATVSRAGPQLRQAAAAARQQLIKLASERIGTSAEQLTTHDGVVCVASNPAKMVSYGDLIGGKHFNLKIAVSGTGWGMKVAPEIRPKDYKDYKIVGTPVPRVDLPAKFTGEFTYVQDVRVPGMLHGRVVRPPTVNSKPTGVDQGSIKDIPGIVKVVEEGNFVGVVAQTEWAAIRAARALKVTWSTPATKLPAGSDEVYAYLKDTKSFQDLPAPSNRGDVETSLAEAGKAPGKTFEATYRWPFQLHGMIGPSCAVADVTANKTTIWTGSQGPFETRNRIAALLGVPQRNVEVIYREESGCYGRLSPDDAPEDAAVMSRAVGKPVRVQWMRADEHAWEPKGPAQVITVRAGVDAQGKVTAWDFLDRSFPWTESGRNPLLAARQVGPRTQTEDDPGFPNGNGGGGEAYEFENRRVTAAAIPWVKPDPTPLRTSNLRAPGELARSFASESFMDEIAARLGVDPVQFRLRYLVNNKRPAAALLAAAKAAHWKERPSPAPAATGAKAWGRGVAVGYRLNTMTAAVAEVEVDRTTGKVVVKRVTFAHDCGLIVNPNGLKNQIEGNIIQGVSRTLLEEVRFDASGIKSLDWISYPILTYQEVPEIDIVLINRPELGPMGAGEPSIVVLPGAIGNAIFDAVGVRVRDVPLTPQRVLNAMQAKGAA